MGRNARRSKKDANHDAIGARFLALGCSVKDLYDAGIEGLGDYLIGCVGVNHLVEVKNPETRYGRAGLNEAQGRFNAGWRGEQMIVVSTELEVDALVTNWRRACR